MKLPMRKNVLRTILVRKTAKNAAREHANAKCLDSGVDRTIIYDADSQIDEPCFRDEYFSPVLATISIPGDNPSAFIQAAVQFANEKAGMVL